MERSTLSKAHEAGRKAVKLSKKGLYAESALHHIEAAKLFQELESKISAESLATHSLKEQRRYHQRQAEITKKIRDAVDKEKGKIKMDEPSHENPATRPAKTPKHVMDMEIRRNFEEFDSLLLILSDTKSNPPQKIASQGHGLAPVVEYTKRPKSDKDVIEELQTVNSKLRSLVTDLWDKLRIAEEEKRILEKRLEIYEQKSGPQSSSNFIAMINQLPAASLLPELSPLEQPPEFQYS